MKRLIGLMIFMGLAAATPALAQQVTIDYAHDFDFKPVKTFRYVDTKDTNIQNSLMAGRVVTAIRDTLRERGLSEVEEGGDLFVTYHYSSQQNQVFNTTTMGMGGMGMGPGWGGWGRGGVGMSSSSTTASTYTEGTLVIDAFDPEHKTLVWRGTGTVTLKAQPEKQMKQVDKILIKLGHRWDKILAGQGK